MSTIRHTSRIVCYLTVLACGFAGAIPLSAAEQEILFEDDYSAIDGSFNSTETIKLSVADHVMSIAADATWFRRSIYQSSVFDDSEVSIQVRLGNPDGEKGAFIGLVFWALDYNDYYYFVVSDSGTIAVASTNTKRTILPVPWRQSKAIKVGTNEWNDLRVVMVGNRATIMINETKVATIKGQPPQGGSLVGLIYNAGSEASVGRVRQFKVKTPSSADLAPVTEVNDPDVILEDDFSFLDPAWGLESGSLFVKDKKLFIKPDPGFVFRHFYQSATAEEVDATVKVKAVHSEKDSTCSAGLVFWGVAADDYWAFQVDEKGQIGVTRRRKDRWLYPLTYNVPAKETKFNPNGSNELRVVTSGKIATLYLNGVLVGVVNGVVIKGEWQFGLHTESGKVQGIGEFSSLVVRKPRATVK